MNIIITDLNDEYTKYEWNGHQLIVMRENKYINLSNILRKCKKTLKKWKQRQDSEYVMNRVAGQNQLPNSSSLFVTMQSPINDISGVYIHPDLAGIISVWASHWIESFVHRAQQPSEHIVRGNSKYLTSRIPCFQQYRHHPEIKSVEAIKGQTDLIQPLYKTQYASYYWAMCNGSRMLVKTTKRQQYIFKEHETLTNLQGVSGIANTSTLQQIQHPETEQLQTFIPFMISDGIFLSQLIQGAELSLAMVCTIIYDLAKTLKIMQDRGTIQLDLSPDNIFIAHDGGQFRTYLINLQSAIDLSKDYHDHSYYLDADFVAPDILDIENPEQIRQSPNASLGLLLLYLIFGDTQSLSPKMKKQISNHKYLRQLPHMSDGLLQYDRNKRLPLEEVICTLENANIMSHCAPDMLANRIDVSNHQQFTNQYNGFIKQYQDQCRVKQLKVNLDFALV